MKHLSGSTSVRSLTWAKFSSISLVSRSVDQLVALSEEKKQALERGPQEALELVLGCSSLPPAGAAWGPEPQP